jgi:hypothetical protein
MWWISGDGANVRTYALQRIKSSANACCILNPESNARFKMQNFDTLNPADADES